MLRYGLPDIVLTLSKITWKTMVDGNEPKYDRVMRIHGVV